MEKGIATITINDEPPKPTTFEDLGYVQVIRCKDCVKRGFDDCPVNGWMPNKVTDDFFCADGERK